MAVTILLSVLSLPLLAFGAVGFVGNLWLMYKGLTGKWRGSLIPIPGAFTAAGLLLFPIYPLQRYAWVPVVLDPTCVAAIIFLTGHSWRRLARKD